MNERSDPENILSASQHCTRGNDAKYSKESAIDEAIKFIIGVVQCVDRHRFDADSDPTFHLDADSNPYSDPDSISISRNRHVSNYNFLYFHSQQCKFNLSHQCLCVIIFIILFTAYYNFI